MSSIIFYEDSRRMRVGWNEGGEEVTVRVWATKPKSTKLKYYIGPTQPKGCGEGIIKSYDSPFLPKAKSLRQQNEKLRKQWIKIFGTAEEEEDGEEDNDGAPTTQNTVDPDANKNKRKRASGWTVVNAPGPSRPRSSAEPANPRPSHVSETEGQKRKRLKTEADAMASILKHFTTPWEELSAKALQDLGRSIQKRFELKIQPSEEVLLNMKEFCNAFGPVPFESTAWYAFLRTTGQLLPLPRSSETRPLPTAPVIFLHRCPSDSSEPRMNCMDLDHIEQLQSPTDPHPTVAMAPGFGGVATTQADSPVQLLVDPHPTVAMAPGFGGVATTQVDRPVQVDINLRPAAALPSSNRGASPLPKPVVQSMSARFNALNIMMGRVSASSESFDSSLPGSQNHRENQPPIRRHRYFSNLLGPEATRPIHRLRELLEEIKDGMKRTEKADQIKV